MKSRFIGYTIVVFWICAGTNNVFSRVEVQYGAGDAEEVKLQRFTYWW